MPRQKAASLTIQWRILKKLVTDYFFQIFFMGTSCVALSIKNIKTRASREMTSQQKWGERCQALECGRARYLPSLIALLCIAADGKRASATLVLQISTKYYRVNHNLFIFQLPILCL